MAKNIKGVSIEFGGITTKLTKAIKDINQPTKDLEKNLKSVNSALKLDPSNVDLLKNKYSLLSKQVDTNKDRLNELKRIQKDFINQNVDKTSNEWVRLQKEIVFAENSLKKARQELNKFTNENSKINKLAESVKKVGKGVEGLGQKLGGISKMGALATTALGGLAIKSGNVADELLTNAKITHLNTEELQRLSYASQLLDVSQETIFNSLTKTTRAMNDATSGSQKQKESFEKLGVIYKDNEGNLRNSKEVFFEIIDALGKVQNETERDALAMDLLGKSAQELNPLIEQGSNAINELSESAQNIIPNETIQKMGQFDDLIETIKADVGGALIELGGQIATDLLPLLKDFANFIKDVSKSLGNLSPETRKFIYAILLIITVISPLLVGIGKIITIFGFLMQGIGLISSGFSFIAGVIGALVSALGLPVVAIGALVAAFVVAYNTCEPFREMINNLVSGIITFFSNLIEYLTITFKNAWNGFWQGLGDIVNNIFNGIKDTVSGVINFVKDGFDMITNFKIPNFNIFGGGKSKKENVPKLAIGTDRVLSDGLAYLHKGEAVVPSKVVEGGFTGGNSTQFLEAIKQATFNINVGVEMDGREISGATSYIQGIDLKKAGAF